MPRHPSLHNPRPDATMMPRLLCSLFLYVLVFGQTASAPQEPTTTESPRPSVTAAPPGSPEAILQTTPARPAPYIAPASYTPTAMPAPSAPAAMRSTQTPAFGSATRNAGAGGGEGKKSGEYGDTAKSGSGYGKAYYYQYDDKFKDWKIDPNHPIDWLPNRKDGGIKDQSTLTLNDISDLTINDFQVEARNVFHKMDQVMTPVLDQNGKPVLGPD